MPKRVYQFKIELEGITPTIWRRIQVPETYSFWDLHVAIQDAMGWLDYHLHLFRVHREHVPIPIEIGIPDEYAMEGDPQKFSPGKIKFDNPTKRWKRAFS